MFTDADARVRICGDVLWIGLRIEICGIRFTIIDRRVDKEL